MAEPAVSDIGAIDGPILVFGGVYGNQEAFEALIRKARELGFTAQQMLHTGDITAYCADTRACAELLHNLGCPTIRGNVEQQLAESADDCGCGFEEGSECDALSAHWYARANRETTPELRQWMAAMPDQLLFTLRGVRVHTVHGSLTDVSQFMWDSLPQEDFQAQLALTSADMVIAGHTGIPFTRAFGDRVWHNSGALGMPANDGTPRVWYSIVDVTGRGLSITSHELLYDHGKAAAKMRSAGLPEGYARGLDTGFWPSTDILPEKEASETGTPLQPRSFTLEIVRHAAE